MLISEMMNVLVLCLTLFICSVFLGSYADSQLKMMNNVIIHEADMKYLGKPKFHAGSVYSPKVM